MKSHYTADELTAIVHGEKLATKHSIKYQNLRYKFADMSQEQFDEYYYAFVGTTGMIGGLCRAVGYCETIMFNAIVEFFTTQSVLEPLSVSGIMEKAYKNYIDEEEKDTLRMNISVTQEEWSGKTYFSIDDSLQRATIRFLLALAEHGEIQHVAIKTRG